MGTTLQRPPHAGGAPAPYSQLQAQLVARNYAELGCDGWNTREVRRLMAQIGDTEIVMAERLRIRPKDFAHRMQTDCFTRQDGLILTILQRELDATRGVVGAAPCLVQAARRAISNTRFIAPVLPRSRVRR